MMKQVARTLLLFSFLPMLATAQEDWWFDVEVIVFDRNLALTQLEEQFEFSDSLLPVETDLDLISDYLHPDISGLKQSLPICGQGSSPLWVPVPTLQEVIRDYAPATSKSEESTTLAPSSTESFTSNPTVPAPAPAGPVTQRITEEQIASYWLEFLPNPVANPIQVTKLSFCQQPQPWLSWENGKWIWHRPDNTLPYPDEMPVVLDGTDLPYSNSAHILSSQQHALEKLSRQIRQARGLNRLLHVTWRQEVPFGRENAPKVRIFAGKDYGSTFSLTGEQKTGSIPSQREDSLKVDKELADKDDFFWQLEQNLASAQYIPFDTMMAAVRENSKKTEAAPLAQHTAATIPIWQLEGYVKIFLKYINRVPYLHVDSELFYRQPAPVDAPEQQNLTPRYQLKSVPFKQIRRVISKQLHYFDHPLFGMVIEIRRYEKPPENKEQP